MSDKKHSPEGDEVVYLNLFILICVNLFMFAITKFKLSGNQNNYNLFSDLAVYLTIHILVLFLYGMFKFITGNSEDGKYLFLSILMLMIIGMPACLFLGFISK